MIEAIRPRRPPSPDHGRLPPPRLSISSDGRRSAESRMICARLTFNWANRLMLSLGEPDSRPAG